MNNKLILLVFSALAFTATGAQETGGLVGKWTAIINFQDRVQGCGQSVAIAELDIQRRVEGSLNEIYRGEARSWNMGERCGDVDVGSSAATIRVKRGEVTVSYAETDWSDDNLVLDGDVMKGSDESGAELFFTRVGELPLDERAAEARANLFEEMPQEDRDEAMEVMAMVGLEERQAERVMNQVFDGIGQCMIDAVRTTALRNGVDVGKAIDLFDPVTIPTADRSITRTLDLREITIRQRACIHDLTENFDIPRFW